MSRTLRVFIDDTKGLDEVTAAALVNKNYAANLQGLSFQFIKVIPHGVYFFARKNVSDNEIISIIKSLSTEMNYTVEVTTITDDRFTVHLSL